MPKPTIESKFEEIRAKGTIAPIQVTLVTRLVDLRYPDDISAIKGSSRSYVILLEYYSEGITIVVELFKIVFKDHIRDETLVINNIDESMVMIQNLFMERAGWPQVVAVSAVITSFNCTVTWAEKWCILVIALGKYNVSVAIRPTLTSVELHRGNQELLGSTVGLDTTKPELIVGCIGHYLKMVDKTVIVPAGGNHSVETAVFSGTETSNSKYSTLVGAPERSCDYVSTDEICMILEGLMHNVNNNCTGSFADGWREALAAVVNRINIRK